MRLPYSFGRYTLIEKIGNGGVAEVYRAIFSEPKSPVKTVAVKRLLPALGGDEEMRGLIVDEGRALSHLNHPAIAQILELGELEGIPYLAMEFVDGVDLARLLAKAISAASPIPIGHSLYIINHVLAALDFAHSSKNELGHELKLVHRDISPSNILLSWKGEVKVADFGIAKGVHRTRGTKAGQLRGKFAYMAPEQARAGTIDARTDIFACGIVLFELASGQRLFDGESDMEVLEKVKCARLPTGAMKKVSSPLRAILHLALASDPARRYQSAAEMFSDVERLARKLGEVVSESEFSRFLKDIFPVEYAARVLDEPVAIVHDGRETKIINESAVSVPRRAFEFSRLVLMPVFLIAAIFLTAGDATEKKVASKTSLNPVLAAEPKKIKPPLPFVAPPASVEPVNEIQEDARLSVDARPWGIVDVDGEVAGRESPVNALKIKPGSYLIKVRYPPTGKIASNRITLTAGESKRCFASFTPHPVLNCR